MSELLGKVTDPLTLFGLLLILSSFFYTQKSKNKYAIWIFAALSILVILTITIIYPAKSNNIHASSKGASSPVSIKASGANKINAETIGENAPITIESKK